MEYEIIYEETDTLEEIIEVLKRCFEEVLHSEIDRARRCIIERELLEGIHYIEYVRQLCQENNLKLGD